MRKRSRRTSAEKEDDVISQLPDEILVEIINKLNSLIEATRTSVLSARWRNLWTFSSNLNFDPPTNMCKSLSEVVVSRPNYINWVNKVLELHRGSILKEFKIHCELYHSHAPVLTNWIHTAISKGGGVQHFELKLSLQGACLTPIYTFSQECYNSLRSPHGLPFINSLKSLSLTAVNVTGEILHFFVYNCPLLERLQGTFLKSSKFALKIVGPSIRLKYIEFYCCFSIEQVEISAPSLLFFKFYGALNVENVPQLLDVSIGGYAYARLKNYIEPIMSYLPQLHILEFRLHLNFHPTDNVQFLFCELPKLRHLLFLVTGRDDKSLFRLTRMIEACSSLEKFTLKLNHYDHSLERKIKEFPKYAHQNKHLKVVEFIRFVGRPIDLELAYYFLENVVMLEKMIVNHMYAFSRGFHFEQENSEQKEATRVNAQHYLQEKVPQRVEFVIC